MNAVMARLSGELQAGQVIESSRAEDWVICGRVPQAVAFPENEDDVEKLLAIANEEGWHCIPCGNGSWLRGGGQPQAVDLVLSLKRMDQLLAHEPDDLFFEAQAGVRMAELQGGVSKHGQWLPLDPPGTARGSLGATFGIGCAGPLRAGFGTPRDHLLGATVVTGDGKILRLGGKVVKNVAGFDLLKLMAGSWGTLGVITKVTARLYPLPEIDRTLLFECRDSAECAELARSIVSVPIILAAVEALVPGQRESGEANSTPVVAVRLLESQAAVEQAEKIVTDQAGTARFRRLEANRSRATFTKVQNIEEGAELVLRLNLLPSRLPELMALGWELAEFSDPDAGWGVRMAAHAQSGILRIMICRLDRREKGLDRVRVALDTLRHSLESEGGSLVISEGPPDVVRHLGVWGDVGSAGALMLGLQRKFDPRAILSQGRL
ncbi:MAG: FAD-binding oxidoreductase [Gemmatimonadota bacterium]|nr:FAD-binding oxidoreductase [Gemmatimonadota bacterium]